MAMHEDRIPTYTDLRKGFRLEQWEVLPDRGLLRDGEIEEHLEPKMVDVLVLLAAHSGQVVLKEKLIESVWEGRAQSDEPLNRCVSMLRKKLGDDSSNPTFIETIPRRGYRLKASVIMPEAPQEESTTERWSPRWVLGVGALILSVIIVWWSTHLPPAPPDTPMRSVAVFPFQCRGATEKYLCFGFSEALTSTLWHVKDIKVVRIKMPFPDQDSYQEVASRLGVDGLLTGSVQRMGTELRITAELIDGRNGFIAFSDTFDGVTEDIFRLQEQVATIVSQSIGADSGRPIHAPSEPASFEAFESYARGQYQFEIRDRASVEESIELFKQTIRIDPMFGPAYLRLAYAYVLLPERDPSLDADSMYELAAAATNTGIMTDPSIREPAGTVFGFIHHKRGEWLESTEAYEAAVTADTVYPTAHHWYSELLASVGRLDDSLYHARRAYELDPDSAVIISRLAIANFWVDDLEQAGRYFDVVDKMKLEVPINDLAAALYLLRIGQIQAAIAVTKSGLVKIGLNTEWVEPVYAGLENPEYLQQSRDLVSRLEAEELLPSYVLMTLWALLGDADRAMQSAFATADFGRSYVAEILYIEQLRILREHKDFPLLLEKNGLLQYWREAGCEWVDDAVQCS